jgi:hypothetical protein
VLAGTTGFASFTGFAGINPFESCDEEDALTATAGGTLPLPLLLLLAAVAEAAAGRGAVFGTALVVAVLMFSRFAISSALMKSSFSSSLSLLVSSLSLLELSLSASPFFARGAFAFALLAALP